MLIWNCHPFFNAQPLSAGNFGNVLHFFCKTFRFDASHRSVLPVFLFPNAIFLVKEKGYESSPPQSTYTTSWWFQPIWKICSSKWIISPNRGENKKYLKPPPRQSIQRYILCWDRETNICEIRGIITKLGVLSTFHPQNVQVFLKSETALQRRHGAWKQHISGQSIFPQQLKMAIFQQFPRWFFGAVRSGSRCLPIFVRSLASINSWQNPAMNVGFVSNVWNCLTSSCYL